MRSRRLALASILVLLALAGCIGGAPADAGEPTNDSPTVVKDPDNYTYVDNASFETGGHVHDYWGGEDELTVVDRTERMGRFTVETAGEDPERIGVMRPPAGTVIPQGTATVRVTVSWETQYGGEVYENPQLRVRTADDHEFRHAADIENGDTVTIESTNAWNDLPHRQLSGWAFAIFVEPVASPGALWYQADVTMEVVAERGLELPVFPAHPDHWKGRSEIDLFEAEPGTMVWDPENPLYGSACIGQGCQGPYDGSHRPDNGTVVPFDAATVRVRVEPTSQSPTRVGLAYHGADSWEYARPEPAETDDRTRIYEIPVTPEMADGPYNEQSLWRFRPYITDPVEDGVYAGGYRMSATVHRNVTG